MVKSIEEAQSILRRKSPEPEALQLIPEAMARKYAAIPLAVEGNVLSVAMANPTDILALEAKVSDSLVPFESSKLLMSIYIHKGAMSWKCPVMGSTTQRRQSGVSRRLTQP